MAMDESSGPVQEQLANAIAIELGVAEALASLARDLDQVNGMAEVERLRTVVQDHVGALAALGRDAGDHSMDAAVSTGSSSRPTQADSSRNRTEIATLTTWLASPDSGVYLWIRSRPVGSMTEEPDALVEGHLLCDIAPLTGRSLACYRSPIGSLLTDWRPSDDAQRITDSSHDRAS